MEKPKLVRLSVPAACFTVFVETQEELEYWTQFSLRRGYIPEISRVY